MPRGEALPAGRSPEGHAARRGADRAADDYLWADISARITFLEPLAATAAGPGVLVPRSAVRGGADAPFAWTVVDGRVHRARETVVVGAPPLLRDGQAVTVAGG